MKKAAFLDRGKSNENIMHLKEGVMKKTIVFMSAFIIAAPFLTASTQDVEKLNRNLEGSILKGDVENVRTLISAGADVNHRFNVLRSKDLTPLFWAVQFGHADICQLLIDAGALVKVEFKATGKSSTLMHVAAASPSGNKAVVNLLVANGLDVNVKRKGLLTPLCLAVLRGTVEALEALIENGADPNVTFTDWIVSSSIEKTPLHEAVLKDKKEVAELLIKGGANVNALSSTGETPLDMAINNSRTEIANLLREHGGISKRK
jgi:ankyrin repeat protein